MTIVNVQTVLHPRMPPTPPPENSQRPDLPVHPAPDFPFKGYLPSQPEGYQQSASNPSEHAIVIDNGQSTLLMNRSGALLMLLCRS